MSLVIARRTDARRIRVMADTRVTNPDPGAIAVPGELKGALKAVVISPTICVGFAGRVDYACDALLALGKDAALWKDHDAINGFLLDQHNVARKTTDFLVASIGPSPRLTKITDGALNDAPTQTWLGNRDAFSSFQRRFNGATPPPSDDIPEERKADLDTASRMSTAFDGIVREDEFDDVGDFVIDIATTRGGLRYMTSSQAFFVEQTISGPGWQTLRFGNAAEGGYAYTIMTPEDAGVGAAAVHFLQRRFGVLWIPLVERDPVVLQGDHDSFIARVEARFGVKLMGGRLS